MKHLKSHIIMLEFIHGRSLNRFDAIRIGDTAVNSTVAELQTRTNILIHREREQVPCRTGGMVSVNRYSIPSKHDRQRAAEWLANQLVKKGRFKTLAEAMVSIGTIR